MATNKERYDKLAMDLNMKKLGKPLKKKKLKNKETFTEKWNNQQTL